MISAVATVFGISSDKFGGPEKSAKAVCAKEVLILVGREQGAGVNELSLIAGLDTSNGSRRYEAARQKNSKPTANSLTRKLSSKNYTARIPQNRRRDTDSAPLISVASGSTVTKNYREVTTYN